MLGEETEVDLKRVHERIGAQGRVSFGSAELLEEVWGVRPGAVTPFGAINDRDGRVTVVLDDAMMAHERLNFHPLVNTRTTALASADLVTVPARRPATSRSSLRSGGSAKRLNKGARASI